MADKKLAGKVAVVTGGGRGIGRETVLALAREGANIVILDVLENEARATAEDARKLGVEAEAYMADVTNSEGIAEVMKTIVERFGRLNILVNNAGITKDNLLLRMTDEEWDRVLTINLRGTFVCTRAVTRQMLRQKSGRIINIASIVGQIGNPGQANYSASKAGMIGFTKTVAKELGSRQITVNAIAPGFIRTAMTEKLSPEAREAMLRNVPLGQYGEAEDVARAILFLAGDDARYITGHVLNVDGGLAM